MGKWQTRAVRTALGALLAYGGVVALARLLCRSFVFPAPRTAVVTAPAGAQLVSFPAADGLAVQALEIPAPAGARTVVLFHGNGETIASSTDRAVALAGRGMGVLLVEYRGYGASEGTASEEGLYADAEGAMRYLASRGTPDDHVALWGTSLGTGVAVEVARRHAVASLVLVTPYTSMVEVVASHAPILPARAIVRDVFDTRAKCGEVRALTLVVHGDADGVVPFWMGKEVAAAIAGAHFVHVRGGGHNDLFVREPGLFAKVATHLAR